MKIKFKSKSHTSEPPDDSNKRHWNARFSWYHDVDRVRGRSFKSLASVCKEQKNSISFVITASTVVEKDKEIIIIIIITTTTMSLGEFTGLHLVHLVKI
jgi:hypothetical protein